MSSTPLIIKEVLGQEIYDQFEKLRNETKPNRTIHILTSPKGKKLLEQAIKKEYERNTYNTFLH